MEVAARTLRVNAPSYAWWLLAVVWLAGFTAPANMAKVMVMAPALMQDLGVNVAQVGLLIGGFYVLGIILAFPAAAVTNKFGVKVTILVAVGCGVLGSLFGVLTTSIGVLFVSRILEGAGFAMMGVAGPSAISPWFPKEMRGRAMGIWAAWVAVAFVITPILYAAIAGAVGWRPVWWITFGFDVVVFVLVLLFVKKPDFFYEGEEEAHLEKIKISEVFKVKSIWLLGAIFLFAELAFMSVNGFLTTYATEVIGADLSTAALIVSACALIGAIAAVLAGTMSDKLKTRKWVLVFCIVVGIIFAAFIFNVKTIGAYWVLIVLMGIAGGGVPAMLWASVPELVRPSQVAGAVAVNAFTQNVGMFIGATVLGNVVMAIGWGPSTYLLLVPCYVICLILVLLTGKQLQ